MRSPLGISITWQYFGFGTDFWAWIGVSTIICLIGALLHELAHKIFAVLLKIKIEYRIWPAGSLLTLVSTYLGNAFSIQGFLIEDIEEGTAKWKVGIMKLAGPFMSIIVVIAFALINVLSPSPLYQIIYSTSALLAMAEMFPFKGLDGSDIKEWNAWIWLTSFVIIGACYAFVMFIL